MEPTFPIDLFQQRVVARRKKAPGAFFRRCADSGWDGGKGETGFAIDTSGPDPGSNSSSGCCLRGPVSPLIPYSPPRGIESH